MTLAFMQKWPKGMGDISGLPNYFEEKIWADLIHHRLASIDQYEAFNNDHIERFGKPLTEFNAVLLNGKAHTIRTDPANRWKAGMDIHMVINNRTKDRFQFAPVVKCVSVQEIEFHWWIPENPKLYTLPYEDKVNSRYCDVYVDGNAIGVNSVKELAIADGFITVEDFFSYFNKDSKKTLIHWTDLRY